MTDTDPPGQKKNMIRIFQYSYGLIYDYDYDLIQGKGDACKPAQYIVTLLFEDL